MEKDKPPEFPEPHSPQELHNWEDQVTEWSDVTRWEEIDNNRLLYSIFWDLVAENKEWDKQLERKLRPTTKE